MKTLVHIILNELEGVCKTGTAFVSDREKNRTVTPSLYNRRIENTDERNLGVLFPVRNGQ